MSKTQKIILASNSASRSSLMKNAGLSFQQIASDVDENIIKSTFLKSGELVDVAMVLAQSKALSISEKYPGAYVVGADQTLLFENKLYDKPSSSAAARDQLLALRGKKHQLETAVCVMRNSVSLWAVSDSSYLTMRDFSPAFLGKYLASEGDNVKTSVGGYKLEGQGLQLFEKIDGDFFSILGLPMLKLLSFLRTQNLIET